MSLNYVLLNGVTMGFGSEQERDAYLASSAGAGAQTQDAAMAANPGQSMEQIKNQNYAQHYSPQGAGYGAVPQGERDFGGNAAKNQWIAEQTGYGGNFGGQYTNNFGTWAQERGINTGDLESAWNAQQQQPRQPGATGGISAGGHMSSSQPIGSLMGQPQGSWSDLASMQGLLGNYGGQMGGLLTGGGFPAGQASQQAPMQASQQAGLMGGMQTAMQSGGWGQNTNPSTANSSHTMLWSR